MKKEILILGTIFLFIGVGIQPAFAVEPVKISKINREVNTNPKEYLFQTIVDIANNPDVKDLLDLYEDDLLNVDIDRSVYCEIFFRKPRLLFDLLFTKPSMTTDYLDSMYNQGCQIINTIGEDEAIEVFKQVTITNHEIFGDINNIVMIDNELSEKITIIKETNRESKFYKQFYCEPLPIYCYVLFILALPLIITGEIIIPLMDRIEYRSLLWYLLLPIYFFTDLGIALCIYLMVVVNCLELSK